jgi:hypothetical protein
MDWFLESVKLIGAVLGIATAAFIVFDRVFRNRPIFPKNSLGKTLGRSKKNGPGNLFPHH